MKKFRLSFNKKSAVDIISAVLILAVVALGFANYFGLNITSDQVESLIKSVGLILGFFGLSLNTSTGTSQFADVNVSSESMSQAFKFGQEFASAVVPEAAVNSGLTKADRKKYGVQQVLSNLAQAGLHLDPQTVAGLVERAYQLYKASGGKSVDVATTPYPDDEESDGEVENDE